MNALATAAEISATFILGTLAVLVLVGCLVGSINLSGLLSTKGSPEGELSPARVQALLVTLAAAFNYLSLVVSNPDVSSLPDVPTGVVATVGASHLFYLGSKVYALLGATNKKD